MRFPAVVNETGRRGRVESIAHAFERPQEFLIGLQAKQGK